MLDSDSPPMGYSEVESNPMHLPTSQENSLDEAEDRTDDYISIRANLLHGAPGGNLLPDDNLDSGEHNVDGE